MYIACLFFFDKTGNISLNKTRLGQPLANSFLIHLVLANPY